MLPPLPLAEWSDADRDLFVNRFPRSQRFLSGEPDAPPLPDVLGLFAHHPALTARWLDFSAGLLDAGELDAVDRELVILRVAWRTDSSYEWAEHLRLGRAAGLTEEQIASAADEAAQHLLLRAADEQITGHRVSAETWAELAQRYTQRQLLELVFLIGSYVCLAGVLNSAGVEADQETEDGHGPLAEAG